MQKLFVRRFTDQSARVLMILVTLMVLLLFVAIIFMLTGSSGEILSVKSLSDLLFSSAWDYAKDEYGLAPAIFGTFVVTILSMLLAVPVAILGAIYISEYANGKYKTAFQAFIDVLAGIPSVVYGLCGLILLVPFVKDVLGPIVGVQTTGLCVFSAAMVLAVMVLPIIVSITVESLQVIPLGLREQFCALGATKWQLVEMLLLKAGGSGIVSGIVLGFGRAMGETIAIAMVIGNKNIIGCSLFSPGQTLPSIIVNSFSEMMSVPLHRSALMLASLILLCVVIFFNVLASIVRNKLQRRWRYE